MNSLAGYALDLASRPIGCHKPGNFAPILVGQFANKDVRRNMEAVENVWQGRNQEQ